MLVFYNPHVDDFLAEPLQFRILKRRPLKKYGFMIDEARLSGDTINVLVDATSSGVVPEALFHRMPSWLRIAFSKLEFLLWKKVNRFGKEVRQVAIPEGNVEDVLLTFSYKSATGEFALRETTFEKYHAVVFHLSHYFLSTSEKSRNIRKLRNAYLAGDSDITNIAYFQKFFGWYSKPFLVLPFAVGARFLNKQPWSSRDTRAVATGSFHDLRLERPAYKYIDFMEATGEATYHPVRQALHNASADLCNDLDCRVSPYRNYGEGVLDRFLRHFAVAQKHYFSINMVDLYNKHRYAIVGEELSGFPALGALEAMACGCILIADPEYYVGLGLIPQIHYLAYDSGIENLLQKLRESQSESYENISIDASEYVRAEFGCTVMHKKWLSRLSSV